MGNIIKYKSMSEFHNDWKHYATIFQNPGKKEKLVSSTSGFCIGQLKAIQIRKNSFLEQEMKLYDLRQSSRCGNLVNILSAYTQSGISPLGKNSQILTVVAQRIPYKMHQIQGITSEQAVYLANGIFSGLQQLYTHIRKPFSINQCMIGVNYFGVVKLWHNKKTEDNMPPQNLQFSPRNEAEMVDIVMDLVSSKLKRGEPYPHQFTHIHNNLWKSLGAAFQITFAAKKKMNIGNIKKNLMINLLNKKPLPEQLPEYVKTHFNLESPVPNIYNQKRVLQNYQYRNLKPSLQENFYCLNKSQTSYILRQKDDYKQRYSSKPLSVIRNSEILTFENRTLKKMKSMDSLIQGPIYSQISQQKLMKPILKDRKISQLGGPNRQVLKQRQKAQFKNPLRQSLIAYSIPDRQKVGKNILNQSHNHMRRSSLAFI